jgi:hypothetical protein
LDNVPTTKIILPIDSVAVLKSGLVKPENADWIPPYLLIDLAEQKDYNGEVVKAEKRNILKHEIMILDMLKNNSDWERPIYYAITVSSEQYLRLESYFRQDGIAYRIMPFVAARDQRIDTDILYDNLMHKYRYGNLEEPNLYVDENSARMSRTFRILFGRLSKALINENDSVRAKEVLDYALKAIPSYNIPYDYLSIGDIADSYSKIGEKEKAAELFKELAEVSVKNLNWYSRLNNKQYASVINEVRNDLVSMQYILSFFKEYDNELFEQYSFDYGQSYGRYEQFEQFISGTQKRGGLNR